MNLLVHDCTLSSNGWVWIWVQKASEKDHYNHSWHGEQQSIQACVCVDEEYVLRGKLVCFAYINGQVQDMRREGDQKGSPGR